VGQPTHQRCRCGGRLSNGDIGIVTLLHERMHRIDRFRDDFGSRARRVGARCESGSSVTLIRLALLPWASDLALPADDPLLVLRSSAMSRGLAVMIAAAGVHEIRGGSREPGGNLHGNLEHAVFLWREQILLTQRLMDASPFRSGNSQHFSLRLDAVVDPLRLPGCLHDHCLIILRNKSIVEPGRKEIGNRFAMSLYPRPARLLLAPLGNVENALRRSDYVLMP
jgi:hypothetical protein